MSEKVDGLYRTRFVTVDGATNKGTPFSCGLELVAGKVSKSPPLMRNGMMGKHLRYVIMRCRRLNYELQVSVPDDAEPMPKKPRKKRVSGAKKNEKVGVTDRREANKRVDKT